jgi:hypothetical protein
MCNSPKKKRLSISGCILTGDLPGKNSFSQKGKKLEITLTMYSLLGHKSEHSTNNKLLIYKTILKPIWTYGIHPWVWLPLTTYKF